MLASDAQRRMPAQAATDKFRDFPPQDACKVKSEIGECGKEM
jgi:hypothetical protein